ncbi:hypothetical protein [Streptomyces sp. NPDC048106]|uniref:hypothetical protein n=1 Tax=Streptomyces sp. NPDC048106 TaxID=3155750 RepID=UPI0034531C62
MRATGKRPDSERPEHRGAAIAPVERVRTPERAYRPGRGRLSVDLIQDLQGTVGNLVVSRMVGGHEGPAPAPTGGVPVQRVLEPAATRLEHYANAFEDGGEREGMVAKNSPALAAFGEELPPKFIELDETTSNYVPDPEQPEAKPPLSGGHFKNVFGKDKDSDRAVAVMMENYRAKEEKYTASDAFIHQWSQAQQLLDQEDVSRSRLERQAAAALGNRTEVTDVPDRLPNSIYRQNVSGTAAKAVLGALLPEGKDTLTFKEGEDEFESVMGTVNGKSTLNIVRTFNQIKKDSGGPQYRIKGGGLRRVGENFQLRFDIVEA